MLLVLPIQHFHFISGKWNSSPVQKRKPLSLPQPGSQNNCFSLHMVGMCGDLNQVILGLKMGRFRLLISSSNMKHWSKDRIHLKEKNAAPKQSLLHSNFHVPLAEFVEFLLPNQGTGEVPNTGPDSVS